jgi:predicted homoserine dehydrogenase-like protein
MWIVDTELKARADQNRPIRVGIVGAGFMCQGLTNQIVNSTPGMRVVAITNRRPEMEFIDWRRRMTSSCSGEQL